LIGAVILLQSGGRWFLLVKELRSVAKIGLLRGSVEQQCLRRLTISGTPA